MAKGEASESASLIQEIDRGGSVISSCATNIQRAGRAAIRVGDNERSRSITLPGIGQIGVHDDTRRLRRMLSRGTGQDPVRHSLPLCGPLVVVAEC